MSNAIRLNYTFRARGPGRGGVVTGAINGGEHLSEEMNDTHPREMNA